MRIVSDRERTEFDAYSAALFSQPSVAAIETALRDVSPPSPYRIRAKALYSTEAFLRLFDDLARRGTFTRLSESSVGYAFQPKRADDLETTVYFAVLPTEQNHTSALVTIAPRLEWQLLLRALRREYPRLVPIYLSQRELLQAVAALRRQVVSSLEIRVRELSAKETLDGPDGKFAKSVREWTDEDWEKTLGHVLERRQLVTSVSLAFHRRIGERTDPVPSVLCKLSKRGEVESTGRFDLLWTTAVSHIAEVGERKLAFYSKRGLREAEYAPRPVVIRYGSPVFEDIAEVRRLVSTLTKYPQSMHAVTHGNPYVFVQVADNYDGSGFDVWAVSPEMITVFPRLKATAPAFDRLIHYIFDAFREGTVENAE